MPQPRAGFIRLSDDVPGFLRARYYTFLAISFLPGGVLLGLSLFGFDEGWPVFTLLATYPFLVVLLILQRRRMLAVIERGRSGEPICWGCGYDLVSITSPGTCPECGNRFELGELRKRWERAPLQ